MSAIVGVLESTDRPVPECDVARMFDAMHSRGGVRRESWCHDGIALGVSRQDWELERGFSGPVGVLEQDGLVVAADATLYYVADLRRKLRGRGVRLHGDTPSHAILAAYRAWGTACTEHLEGDYAFALWDGTARRLICARDFAGKRTLHYAEVDGALLVASTVAGVLANPRCPAELDLAAIAQTAGALALAPSDTCYRAVRALGEGCVLTWEPGRTVHISRVWRPPEVRAGGGPPFEEAAEVLRGLLIDAAAERMVPEGATAVYLSGGWDSTAVFGAGAAALREERAVGTLRPVSISYPPGDPGHEDELIAAVAEHWHVPVHWLDIKQIPFFDRDQERAALRDEPFAHPYELWHRALARGCRAVGAHAALDGTGGDQLFQVSEVYLADLLARGRWIALSREWEAKGLGGSGFRNFFRLAIQPRLPAPALQAAALLRGGRPLIGYLERQLPGWFRPDFVRAHALVERERALAPARRGGSCAAHETRWYLTYPYFPRIFGCVAALNLDEGVESRSPLYDQRVIEFALSRPREERSFRRETKRLLRRAMRGLLPEHVLAPRSARTGVTSGYFERSMREGLGQWTAALCDRPLLERFGIIDAEALRRSVQEYDRHGESNLGVRLYFTLQTEMWLRGRIGAASAETPRREVCAITG